MTAMALAILLCAADHPRAELLVEPADLQKLAVAHSWVILDAREEKAYRGGHIAGAIWVDHAAWAKGFGQGSDTAAWSNRIGALGISADKTVVIYDANQSKDAARIWWILKYWGVKDVRILNGGWKSWNSARLPVILKTNPPTPVPFAATAQAGRFSDKQALLGSLKDQSIQIIDARSEKEHCGQEALNNPRAGSIPGAKHLEWSELIDPQTDRFREAAQLKELFAKAGIELERPSATHCQSGGRASVMAFGMELMGAPKVANYYPGWSQWGKELDLPLEKPAPKPKP